MAAGKRNSDTFRLTATVDIPDDMTRGTITHKTLREMMSLLKSMGVSRVHWLYYGDIDADSLYCQNIYHAHWCRYGPSTLEAIGEPLEAGVRAAHEAGLEIYGVYKPYYDGLSGTFPDGSPEAVSVADPVYKRGGVLQVASNFLKRHPEFRLQTCSDAETSPRPFGRLQSLRIYSSNSQDPNLSAEHFRLWVSSRNYQYQLLDTDFTFSKGITAYPKTLYDYYGNVAIEAGSKVFTYTFSNLNIPYPYLVLECCPPAGHQSVFLNAPQGMVELRDFQGNILPHLVANHAATWVNPRDFRSYGLEFDMGLGAFPYYFDQGWGGTSTEEAFRIYKGEDFFEDAASVLFGRATLGGFIGLTLGKNAYAASSLCETYPEVREYWSGQVERILATGVDGVDIRISAHGALADDPDDFGYNPCVLDKIPSRIQENPDQLDETVRKIRGAAFSQFLRTTSTLCHSRKVALQAHFNTAGFAHSRSIGQAMGFPGQIDFQWKDWLEEGILDSVLLRNSWYEGSEESSETGKQTRDLSEIFGEPLCKSILDACKGQSVPVILNRYIGRARDIQGYVQDLKSGLESSQLSGFDLYEFFDLASVDSNSSLLNVHSKRVDPIRSFWTTKLTSDPSDF